MKTCGKMVEQGGFASFPCTVEVPDDRSAHEGPCATPDKPATVRARERWLDEHNPPGWRNPPPTPPRCGTCNDTGLVAAVPGLPGEGTAPCPMCTPPEEYERWSREGFKRREGDQPVSVRNDRTPVQQLIIDDWKTRLAVGVARYGTGLQPFNGRNGFRDFYEELIDGVNYLRQVIEERKEMAALARQLETWVIAFPSNEQAQQAARRIAEWLEA